jgi:hypothetical protein
MEMVIIVNTELIVAVIAGTGYKKKLLATRFKRTSAGNITALVMARRRAAHRLQAIGERSIQSRGVNIDS